MKNVASIAGTHISNRTDLQKMYYIDMVLHLLFY